MLGLCTECDLSCIAGYIVLCSTGQGIYRTFPSDQPLINMGSESGEQRGGIGSLLRTAIPGGMTSLSLHKCKFHLPTPMKVQFRSSFFQEIFPT